MHAPTGASSMPKSFRCSQVVCCHVIEPTHGLLAAVQGQNPANDKIDDHPAQLRAGIPIQS